MTNQKMIQSVNNRTWKKHKIIMIIGDIHVKNCATELEHNLGVHFKVSSFVKSGAES